jgi:hypothetical protein
MVHVSVLLNFQAIINAHQTNLPENVKFSIAVETCPLRISAGTVGILSENSYGFSQYLQANSRLEPLNMLQQPPLPF